MPIDGSPTVSGISLILSPITEAGENASITNGLACCHTSVFAAGAFLTVVGSRACSVGIDPAGEGMSATPTIPDTLLRAPPFIAASVVPRSPADDHTLYLFSYIIYEQKYRMNEMFKYSSFIRRIVKGHKPAIQPIGLTTHRFSGVRSGARSRPKDHSHRADRALGRNGRADDRPTTDDTDHATLL